MSIETSYARTPPGLGHKIAKRNYDTWQTMPPLTRPPLAHRDSSFVAQLLALAPPGLLGRLAACALSIGIGCLALARRGFHPELFGDATSTFAVAAVMVGAVLIAYGSIGLGPRVLASCQRLARRLGRWLGRAWAVVMAMEAKRIRRVAGRILGFAGFAAIGLSGVILAGGHPGDFLQITALLVVLAFVLGGLVMSHGIRALGKIIAVSFGARIRDAAETEELLGLCGRGRRLAWTGGFIDLVCGLVHVMSLLDSPELVGPGCAISLIGLLYAAVFGEIGFGSARQWVVAQSQDPRADAHGA